MVASADTSRLLDAARRYAGFRSDKAGIARTPIPCLIVARRTEPGDFTSPISRSSICLVLQGAMKVITGCRYVEAGPGETIVLDATAPGITTVSRASIAEPYVGVLIEIDPATVASLTVEIDAMTPADDPPERASNTDEELADTISRLMNLLHRAEAARVLLTPLIRELYYWLLIGKHGAAVRASSQPGSAARRVARAVALIRAEFARALPVEQLAQLAGMSASAFHRHFRALTSMTPLQFQKQIRLTEARRLMVSEGVTSGTAAFAVGYQSVPQFTRDYRRLFGLPPGRETSAARKQALQRSPLIESETVRSAVVGRSRSLHVAENETVESRIEGANR